MQILYFAWLRQRIGTGAETLERADNVVTVQDLIAQLVARGEGYAEAFADLAAIKVAVNQDYVGFDHPLKDDDEVAFFPPVTGG